RSRFPSWRLPFEGGLIVVEATAEGRFRRPAWVTEPDAEEWRRIKMFHLTERVRMEQVVGIGGIFFKARDPKALAAWYREHLGVPIDGGQSHGALCSAGPGEQTVWSTFPVDTPYFGPGPATFMVNYRVKNLDAMLAQLRSAGARVERSE